MLAQVAVVSIHYRTLIFSRERERERESYTTDRPTYQIAHWHVVSEWATYRAAFDPLHANFLSKSFARLCIRMEKMFDTTRKLNLFALQRKWSSIDTTTEWHQDCLAVEIDSSHVYTWRLVVNLISAGISRWGGTITYIVPHFLKSRCLEFIWAATDPLILLQDSCIFFLFLLLDI